MYTGGLFAAGVFFADRVACVRSKGLMHVEKVKTARQKRKRMVDAPVETVAPEIKNQMKVGACAALSMWVCWSASVTRPFRCMQQSTRAGVLAKRDARLRAFLIRKLLPNTKPKAVMHSNKPQRVLDMVETLFHPTSFSKVRAARRCASLSRPVVLTPHPPCSDRRTLFLLLLPCSPRQWQV